MSYGFKKLGEMLYLANFTDVSEINKSLNEGNDIIAGCIDNKHQKPVAVGDYYHSDDCTICLCSPTERLCKQISCAPPTKCDGFIRKDPLHCCDICVPATVLERPNDESSLNTKLGALTVTLFLIVSLILFTFHRLRRKRVLITLRRLQSLRRQEEGCASIDRDEGLIEVFSGATVLHTRSHLTGVDQYYVNGYAFPEAPPAYTSVVTYPRATTSLAVTMADRPPSYNSVSRPRCPPSPKPLTSVLSRTLFSLFPSATVALFSRNRNRRSLTEANEDNRARRTTIGAFPINNNISPTVTTLEMAGHRPAAVIDQSNTSVSPQPVIVDIDAGCSASVAETESSISVCRESSSISSDSESEEDSSSSSVESGEVSSSSTCCCSMCEDEAAFDDDDSDSFLAPTLAAASIGDAAPLQNAVRYASNDSGNHLTHRSKRYMKAAKQNAASHGAAVEQHLCPSCRDELGSAEIIGRSAECSLSTSAAARVGHDQDVHNCHRRDTVVTENANVSGPSGNLVLKSTKILRHKPKVLCKQRKLMKNNNGRVKNKKPTSTIPAVATVVKKLKKRNAPSQDAALSQMAPTANITAVTECVATV